MKLIPATHLTDFRQIISYLQVLSLWILVALLPFRMGVIPRWAMIVAGVLYFIDYGVNKRWIGWRWTKDKWLYVIMIFYYLCIFIWNIGSRQTNPHFRFVVEERLAFPLCGVIGLLGLSDKVKLKHICYVFIITSLLTSYYIILHTGLSFFVLPIREQTIHFSAKRIELVNSHMMYNLYLNISLICAFYLFNNKNRYIKRGERIFVLLTSLWIFYILSLSEGRVGFLTSMFLAGAFVLVLLFRINWKAGVPTLILYILLCGLLVSHHTRLTSNHIEHEPRWRIWEKTWNIIEEKPVFGYGVSGARQALIDEIMNDETMVPRHLAMLDKINHGRIYSTQPHNAFLEAWSEFGIIGLVLLLLIFLFPLYTTKRSVYIYVFLIVCCFSVQCMFDSFFSPLLYCLSIVFFTSSQNAKSVESVVGKPDAIECTSVSPVTCP